MAAKKPKPANIFEEQGIALLSQNQSSETPLTLQQFASRLAAGGAAPTLEETRTAFKKAPLKANWLLVVPDWEDTPIVWAGDSNPAAQHAGVIEYLAERACSAEKPIVPLKDLVKLVAKDFQKPIMEFWTANPGRLPAGLSGITIPAKGKHPASLAIHLKRLPLPEQSLSVELLRTLSDLASRDVDRYPALLHELLAANHPNIKRLADAIKVEPFASQTVAIFTDGKKPETQLFGLAKDLDWIGGRPRVLDALLQKSQVAGDQGVWLDKIQATLKKSANPKLAPVINGELEQAINHRRLPGGMVSIRMGKKIVLFQLKDVQPDSHEPPKAVVPTTNHDASTPHHHASANHFTHDFSVAFDDLFKAGGNLASVKLSNLRSRLSQYSRDEFDNGLNALRKVQKFTLEPNEGQRVTVTPEDEDAAIVEAGQRLYFCRRK